MNTLKKLIIIIYQKNNNLKNHRKKVTALKKKVFLHLYKTYKYILILILFISLRIVKHTKKINRFLQP